MYTCRTSLNTEGFGARKSVTNESSTKNSSCTINRNSNVVSRNPTKVRPSSTPIVRPNLNCEVRLRIVTVHGGQDPELGPNAYNTMTSHDTDTSVPRSSREIIRAKRVRRQLFVFYVSVFVRFRFRSVPPPVAEISMGRDLIAGPGGTRDVYESARMTIWRYAECLGKLSRR